MDLQDIEHLPGDSFNGTEAYANTKRAQVYLNQLWAERYRGKQSIRFFSMHPGWARTPGTQGSLPSFFDNLSLRTAEQGADTCVWLAVADKPSLRDESTSGLFFFDRQPVE